MTAEFVPALLPSCVASTKLPAALHKEITAMGRGRADPTAVETDLLCVLQAHIAGDHQGFVVELSDADCGSAWAAWAAWADGQRPTGILIRTDCPTAQGDEACCAYDGHPGAHTFALTAPSTHLHRAGFQR